jgi:hypothetical protein
MATSQSSIQVYCQVSSAIHLIRYSGWLNYSRWLGKRTVLSNKGFIPIPSSTLLEKVFWSAPMNVTTMGGGGRVDGGRLPKTLFELGSSHLQPYPRKSLHVVLVWVANAVLDVEVETDEGESF